MLPLFRTKFLSFLCNRPYFSQSTDKIKATIHNIFKTLFVKLRQILALFKFCFLLHSKHTASSLRRPTFKGETLSLFVVRLKRDINTLCGQNTDYNVLKHVVNIFTNVSQRSSDISLTYLSCACTLQSRSDVK
jgi:hypothetical protein